MSTSTEPSILPALVNIVRPFAHKGTRGPVALRDCLVRHDSGSTRVLATDMEIACMVTAAEPRREPEAYLVDAASGVPVGDARDPMEFPAVDRLDGETVGEFSITLRDLRRVADHVAVATDTSSARYALGGVLIEASGTGLVTFVGTDGRRLHAARVEAADCSGEVAPNTLLPARVIAAAAKAVKAAAALVGIKGRQADAEEVVITITTKAARLAWGCPTMAVEVFARLVEGRFPRWKDAVPANTGTACPVDADAVAAVCRETIVRTRAAEKVARAAWVADRVARGWKSTKPGEYRHPRGLELTPAGAVATGCDYRAAITTAVETMLDPEFLRDAVDAAAEFGGSPAVALGILDPQSAVTITAGGWDAGGAGFVAIVMPLARD